MQEYVRFGRLGGIVSRIDRETLEGYLEDFMENGTLAKGCWELRRVDTTIEMRIAPQFDIIKDDNWRTCVYTWVPLEIQYKF